MEMKAMSPLLEVFGDAEERYMPEGPPMSPLTSSYFVAWSSYDARADDSEETLGTILLHLGEAFNVDAELMRLLRLLQDSRMGLYVCTGRDRDIVALEELFTRTVCRAVAPSGYLGTSGDIVYARVLPPPTPDAPHVVFTTPYIVKETSASDWLAYFERTLASPEEYHRHMKYGPTRDYWNEYIMDAYLSDATEAIFLTGLPDVPESLPHALNRS
jgi:hypothetical protein